MNCIQDYVQTQSLGTITAPVNGSWIQAYAEYIGLVAPVNDSWLQAICEEFGIMAPLYGSWTIALADYYGITSPDGTWWCAIAQAAYVPPGGTPPFIWNLDTRVWELETREWNLGVAFSPADIAKYWWVADAGVTQISGVVSSWLDQVGGLTIDQATAGSQPTLTTEATLNNQSVIRFDGTDDYLQRNPITFLPDGNSFTSIVIYNRTITQNPSGIVAQAKYGPATGRHYVITNLGDVEQAYVPFNALQQPNAILSYGGVNTGPKVATYENNATTAVSNYYLNTLGTPGGTISLGTVNQELYQGSTLIFGGYNGGSGDPLGAQPGYYFNGDIAEVIYVPRVMTAGEKTSMATYINTKYGLSI